MSADGSRFIVEDEFHTAAGTRAAVVRSNGGWLDHKARRLVPPPAALLAAFATFPRTPDYTELAPVPPRPEK